jgi:alkylated DNA repair dioxygenase AlkB
MPPSQLSFFEPPPALPGSLRYQAELLTPLEEAALVEQFQALDFQPFQFRGYEGNRRVASFGWRYDFERRVLRRSHDLPPFLIPLRAAAARFAGLAPRDLQQALVTEYQAGVAIGWHKDRPDFDQVVGISFLSPCRFRLRRKQGAGWERAGFIAEPRSAYLLAGPVRTDWEHGIPPVDRLRYSVTFRSLAAQHLDAA